MSMSYAIDVTRKAVTIVDFDGNATTAEFFLHASSSHERPERVVDRLNEPEAFVPVRLDGKVVLQRLRWLVTVEFDGLLPEVEELRKVGAVSEEVELELVTGTMLKGTMIYEAPITRQRLSDHLNDSEDRFLLVVSGNKTMYVQNRAILRVH